MYWRIRGQLNLVTVFLAVVSIVLAPGGLAVQLSQFVPSGVAASIPARLVFRLQDLADAWHDPLGRVAVLQDDLNVDAAEWRQLFAATGGVAAVGPRLGNGQPNFTITGDPGCPDANCSSSAPKPVSINFNEMAGAMLVGTNGTLVLEDLIIYYIANASDYQYSSAQPYRSLVLNADVWPTFAVAPGGTLELINVTVAYRNPTADLTCEQRVDMAILFLRQLQPHTPMIAYNKTAGRIPGYLEYTVPIYNGSGGNVSLGRATLKYRNITFNCLPLPTGQEGPGLIPGQIAAAVAIPTAVALAGLVAWLIVKRRSSKASNVSNKDVECQNDLEAAGACASLDCRPSRPSSIYSSKSTAVLTGGGSGGCAAITATAVPAANWQHQENSVHSQHSLPADKSDSPGHISGHMQHAASGNGQPAQPVCAGFPQQTPQLQQQSVMLSQQESDPRPASTASNVVLGLVAIESFQDSGAFASNRGPSYGESDDPYSGSFALTGASTKDRAGSGGSRPAVDAGSRGVPALLKARSEMSVLRDLKLGLLLGRGSYGRVYKGRWKSVTVAVKIIEHHSGPGTSSKAVNPVKIGQETLLATVAAHPNVVQTYHVSTMTVSERSGLSNGWPSGGREQGKSGRPSCAAALQSAGAVSAVEESTAVSMSDEEDSGNQLETWMLMEFCERGSLERAIATGTFVTADRKPDMNGIYKALLDTASGLDYLHSIGVVHGDLKTANVLLKGSTRDVRGFACKITDFGLSRVLDLDATHISTRTYGTIMYMPAELLLDGHMTQATDIYSFGLMMWELYSSTPVFEEGTSVGQMFYMIAYQNWRPDITEGCPAGYADLMQACWHQDPEQRPTAQRVLKTLRKLCSLHKQARGGTACAPASGQQACTAEANTAAAATAALKTAEPVPAALANPPQHAAGGSVGVQRWYPLELQPSGGSGEDMATGGASGHMSVESQVTPVCLLDRQPGNNSMEEEMCGGDDSCVTPGGHACQTWAAAVQDQQQHLQYTPATYEQPSSIDSRLEGCMQQEEQVPMVSQRQLGAPREPHQLQSNQQTPALPLSGRLVGTNCSSSPTMAADAEGVLPDSISCRNVGLAITNSSDAGSQHLANAGHRSIILWPGRSQQHHHEGPSGAATAAAQEFVAALELATRPSIPGAAGHIPRSRPSRASASILYHQ